MRRIIVPLLLLLLPGCFGAKEAEWHQKLSLHVQTPEGPAAFSAVTKIHCKASYALDINARKSICRESGEAIVAPLGDRTLFALLDGVALGYNGVFIDAFRTTSATFEQSWRRIRTSHGRVFELPRDAYPMLVSFADIDDPASVFEVNPTNLAAAFGPGFALQKITLEVTRDPVTEGRVEAVLGWLAEYRTNYFRLNGQKCVACPVDGTFAETIGTGRFRLVRRK